MECHHAEPSESESVLKLPYNEVCLDHFTAYLSNNMLLNYFNRCKFNLYFQLEQALKLENGSAGGDDPGTKSLVQQNIELRRKLEEEHGGYKRKLQAYQDGQQRQAQLVQKLQAKVGSTCELLA